MDLTPDQLHAFQTSQRWSDFRALFPTREDALKAHATASQSLDQTINPTHHLEWRLIYHDRESGLLLLLALLTMPLGIHYTRHNEYRFITTHAFTRQEAHRLMLHRALASLSYYACFILIILCGVGLVVGVISQLLGGLAFRTKLLSILSLLCFVLFLIAAGKTRSLGLPENLKPIAKDTFDLLSIKAIKSTRPA